jgi:hypothetical protein
MSATRHATDANAEALRLSLALEDICANALRGVMPTTEELAALHRQSRFVQYHTARAVHSTSLPSADRRDPAAAIPAMAQEVVA